MRIERVDSHQAKGWLAGGWESDLPLSIGYANQGVDDPHVHSRVTEIFLVARGSSSIRVGDQTVELRGGDVLILEPGEPHTFLRNSEDYLHFVIHVPGLSAEEARAERSSVDRSALGLG